MTLQKKELSKHLIVLRKTTKKCVCAVFFLNELLYNYGFVQYLGQVLELGFCLTHLLPHWRVQFLT